MFSIARKQPYESLPPESPDAELLPPMQLARPSLQSRLTKVFLSFAIAIAVFGIGRWSGYSEANSLHFKLQEESCRLNGGEAPAAPKPITMEAAATTRTNCSNVVYRQEWRTLSKFQKEAYISAVNCLAKTPSVLGMNGTLYDDFPWVHNQFAHGTHGKAAFFSWHRRFIAVYESYLQKHCGYNGTLPYWDWTLDWENIEESPIFSSELGFGGDGDRAAPTTIGGGHCVQTGPFSHLKPQYYGSRYDPHCLSRGFANFPVEKVTPTAVQAVLDLGDYETFFLATENGPHNVAPFGIKGDFDSFTAPYDPIFFLHHAQLDRLWFLWQMKNPLKRLVEYSGMSTDNQAATLNDVVSVGGLAKDVQVSSIMDTEAGELCYAYTLS